MREEYCLMPRLSRHVLLNPQGILSNTDNTPRRDKQTPQLIQALLIIQIRRHAFLVSIPN